MCKSDPLCERGRSKSRTLRIHRPRRRPVGRRVRGASTKARSDEHGWDGKVRRRNRKVRGDHRRGTVHLYTNALAPRRDVPGLFQIQGTLPPSVKGVVPRLTGARMRTRASPHPLGMDRRHFLLSSLAGALAAPLAVEAQQAAKPARIGIILYRALLADMTGPEPKSPYMRAFVHGMRDLGWVEGRTIEIERRSAEGQPDRLPALTREIVDLNVRVIVVSSTGHAAATKAIAPTIPIVMATSALPEQAGLVKSLAKPGGTVTG